jgi:hypothetical protein
VNAKFLSSHLKSRDSALSCGQYCRLMVVSLTVGVWGVFWICLEIAWTSQDRTFPVGTWDAIHEYDSLVLEAPTIVLGSVVERQILVIWWSIPGAAYVFFILLGTNYDILSEYPKLWNWFRTTVLRQTLSDKMVTMSTVRSRYVRLFCGHFFGAHMPTVVFHLRGRSV